MELRRAKTDEQRLAIAAQRSASAYSREARKRERALTALLRFPDGVTGLPDVSEVLLLALRARGLVERRYHLTRDGVREAMTLDGAAREPSRAELAAENARLREMLGLITSDSEERLVERLGLKRTAARLALRLFTAQGEFVASANLANVFRNGAGKALHVHVCQIRKVLGPDAVLTRDGRLRLGGGAGYALSAEGLEKVGRALKGRGA